MLIQWIGLLAFGVSILIFFHMKKVKVFVAGSSPTLCELWTVARQAICPWDFPGKNTGAGCHFLLQGIFPTQRSNLGLLHCRQILYYLSHQGSPRACCLPIREINPRPPMTGGDTHHYTNKDHQNSLTYNLNQKLYIIQYRRKVSSYFHYLKKHTGSPFFFFNWCVIDLQCCANYCCTAKWFIYIHTHTHTHTLYSFPLWFIITGYWKEFPVLYSRTMLFIHSVYKSLHLLISNSHSTPSRVLSPCATHQSVLYVQLKENNFYRGQLPTEDDTGNKS